MTWLALLFAIGVVVSQQRTASAGRLASALAVWLKAGRTPLEALRGLRDSTESPAIARGLGAAVGEMEGGAPLSQALGASGLVLPASFLEGLRAVEESGQVTRWLDREAQRFAWRADVRGKGLLGLIYPMLVMLLLFEVAIFLGTFIMPTFVSLFEGMGMVLPRETSLLIRVMRVLTSSYGNVLSGGLVLALVVAVTFPRVFPLLDLLTGLPIIRRFRDLAGCEEAASVLGALMPGSASLPASLHTAARVVSTKTWRSAFTQAERDVLMGTSLSDSLRRRSDIPRVFVEVCEVGERAEDLPQTFTELGGWYQLQLERFTHRFIRLGEVALIWSLGLVVFVYALGVWMPLAQLVGTMVP